MIPERIKSPWLLTFGLATAILCHNGQTMTLMGAWPSEDPCPALEQITRDGVRSTSGTVATHSPVVIDQFGCVKSNWAGSFAGCQSDRKDAP
jgi:hypothetical protein